LLTIIQAFPFLIMHIGVVLISTPLCQAVANATHVTDIAHTTHIAQTSIGHPTSLAGQAWRYAMPRRKLPQNPFQRRRIDRRFCLG
jgi:hypothetical protein